MRKFLIISLLASSSIIFDRKKLKILKQLTNCIKEKNFKSALIESEKFLEKYPESKHQKSMRDKVAKIYFLEKEYKKLRKYLRSYL